MRALARAGKNVLQEQIPDSGSAGRLMMQAGLLGGGAVGATSGNDHIAELSKALLIGGTAGRLLNSPMAANYLANGAGKTVQGMARTLKPLPYLFPAIANAKDGN